MAFLETPRFPDRIAYTTAGGPNFSTDVVQITSGAEVRNANWSTELMKYDVAHTAKTQAELDELQAFFRSRRGRAEGFRFKDFADYAMTTANGRLGTAAVGTGYPTYQLYKRYTTGAVTHDRKIVKPVSGTVYRNAGAVAAGSGAGEIALATATGIVTFVSDSTQTITAITPGASTTITIAAAQTPLVAGDKVYISGVGGTIGAALNGIAHTISSKAGSGSLTFTISTNTTGLVWTSGGSVYAYPQADDALTFAGEFDVPVRFDVDAFSAAIIGGTAANRIYSLDSLPLVELRL